MSGSDDHVGGSVVETWVRTSWPWLLLALGSVIIAFGGILFSLHSP